MRYGVVLFVAVALSSGVYVLGSQQTERSNSINHAVSSPPTPPYHRSARDAKPLPKLVPASNFTDRPLVFKAYQIAHEIPFVLAQQPCYCRCDKEFGHGSLLDCYASAHTAGCGICLKETFFTFQMTREGKAPAQIRDAIIRGDWKNTDLEKVHK
jgi:Protein of unknown function with PCYCGC motif